jgi:hypothetical protein
MTQPTPAATPDPDNTQPAETESGNPGEGGHDTHFGEEQAGLDPDVVTPAQDATKDEEKGALHDTDPGTHG